jgi:hypothetical protein
MLIIGVSPSLTGDLNLENLETADGDESGYGVNVDETNLTSIIGLQKLTSARHIHISGNTSLKSVPAFTSLTTLTDFGVLVYNNPALTSLDFPVLTTINYEGWKKNLLPNGLNLMNNQSLVSVKVPALKSIYGVVNFDNNRALKTADLRSLTSSTHFISNTGSTTLLLNKNYERFITTEGVFKEPDGGVTDAFSITDAAGRVFTSAPDYFAAHPGV